MLLAFFDSKGLIYTHFVLRGSTVNAAYIVKVLDIFMRHFKKKRPVMAEQSWFFLWDNAPVYTAAIVQDWLVAHDVQVLRHPPYSPDLAPADFFLFRRVKEELAGVCTLKKEWEGVMRSISAEEFATAFRRWFEHCQKCIEIGGG
jgi:histone-lysine N-methyltransferase SETMAR